MTTQYVLWQSYFRQVPVGFSGLRVASSPGNTILSLLPLCRMKLAASFHTLFVFSVRSLTSESLHGTKLIPQQHDIVFC